VTGSTVPKRHNHAIVKICVFLFFKNHGAKNKRNRYNPFRNFSCASFAEMRGFETNSYGALLLDIFELYDYTAYTALVSALMISAPVLSKGLL
jgi:hypothetical protein